MSSDNQIVVKFKESELQELLGSSHSGVWWSMQDLEERTRRKQKWIKENILFPTQFRKVLDVENGGFVFYPKEKGQRWSFQAVKMAIFLDEYFGDIHKNNN